MAMYLTIYPTYWCSAREKARTIARTHILRIICPIRQSTQTGRSRRIMSRCSTIFRHRMGMPKSSVLTAAILGYALHRRSARARQRITVIITITRATQFARRGSAAAGPTARAPGHVTGIASAPRRVRASAAARVFLTTVHKRGFGGGQPPKTTGIQRERGAGRRRLGQRLVHRAVLLVLRRCPVGY